MLGHIEDLKKEILSLKIELTKANGRHIDLSRQLENFKSDVSKENKAFKAIEEKILSNYHFYDGGSFNKTLIRKETVASHTITERSKGRTALVALYLQNTLCKEPPTLGPSHKTTGLWFHIYRQNLSEPSRPMWTFRESDIITPCLDQTGYITQTLTFVDSIPENTPVTYTLSLEPLRASTILEPARGNFSVCIM